MSVGTFWWVSKVGWECSGCFGQIQRCINSGCTLELSAAVVRALLNAYPQAASQRMVSTHTDEAQSRGYLPLHLAARHRADKAVIALLLAAAPEGVRTAGLYGDLPLHLF